MIVSLISLILKKITDGVHSDDYLVDVIGQVIHVSEFLTLDRLDGYKKDNGSEDGDSLPKFFYLKRLIKTYLKPPGDIVKTVSTGSLDGYNSDDVEELTGDGDSDEASCTEDKGRVEDGPEYQIENDEQDTDTDEVNDRIASTDDDASEVSEDEYDFVDDYDECDDSDCAAESDDDFYEVEEDDYEDGVEDDEEDVDSEYSVVSESEEENLDGCDGKTIEERKAVKLDDYSVHHKISFDLCDSRYIFFVL
ncbi:glutamic acid-rich protein-like [Arabidopsis lyrata subsp. lyrata]|uniref:glutamic acid-rich protein-like n=1 Tax=Arabidopsis lyrata subsp. lyrata TaxID=81972 RepID=UPI000A29B5C3|nr:glutamic acid-rich protein-like [Arabidopsis lyrata subsp. lyrata]|eukprot:XP_020877214.1 glutamic acid-rich protein-like [Arabidopsis lyrata subsp. lyrata]